VRAAGPRGGRTSGDTLVGENGKVNDRVWEGGGGVAYEL
jgi:hypothetical protein